MILIYVLFVLFSVAMMLSIFLFVSTNALQFASASLNGIEALNLADAGAQEALSRLAFMGAAPGATVFPNSLASATPGARGTVGIEDKFDADASVFSILSNASFSGRLRSVRVLVEASFTPGLANAILTPIMTTPGDVSGVTGDIYTVQSATFALPEQAPQCVAGTSATRLLSPQVMAGTTIAVGPGSFASRYCTPLRYNGNLPGGWTYECANGSLTEVAPTSCTRFTLADGDVLPVNWHPMTPIGMSTADFAALVFWIEANSTAAATDGLFMKQATQNGSAVGYTPATYTPSYWGKTQGAGPVELVVALQPFCVDPDAPAAETVLLPTPPVTGPCSPGYDYYGAQAGGAPVPSRYLDWGLVTDDLGREQAVTFYQAPQCTGSACGNPDGIRYVPLPPQLWSANRPFPVVACGENTAGQNVFDRVARDTIVCPDSTTTVDTTSVVFTGTKSAPEGLVIDNAGASAVVITPNIVPVSPSCSGNFADFSWGMILATGDVAFNQKMMFSGFVYAAGNIFMNSVVAVNGGIFAVNLRAQGPPPPTQVQPTGTALCNGAAGPWVLSPLSTTYRPLSWAERPLNQP